MGNISFNQVKGRMVVPALKMSNLNKLATLRQSKALPSEWSQERPKADEAKRLSMTNLTFNQDLNAVNALKQPKPKIDRFQTVMVSREHDFTEYQNQTHNAFFPRQRSIKT